MAERAQYFRKFPITIYNDVPSLNITRRVSFNNNIKNFYSAFYSHVVKSGERLETLAHDYYGDVDYDWLIYHVNDIVDPYHDVALHYEDFEGTIIKKYGSVRLAKLKTFAYRNNYRGDPSVISIEAYNSLPGARKKYWKPQLGPFGIIGYERNEDEMYASTNKIISYSFAETVETPFTVGEIVKDTKDLYSATVASCNTSYVTLQHIEGGWSASSDFDVVGDESNITITFNHATYKLIQDVIPPSEQIYFSPYSFYDYEEEQNDAKQEIYLIKDSYTEIINEQLNELMK